VIKNSINGTNQNHELLSSRTQTTTNVVRMWGKRNLMHCWQECKLAQPLWKTIWKLLKKTKNRTAIQPSNIL
jgi:hypothetical protein